MCCLVLKNRCTAQRGGERGEAGSVLALRRGVAAGVLPTAAQPEGKQRHSDTEQYRRQNGHCK